MQKAQGTIEYLVIIAVIVVIGLVVVALMMNFMDPAQTISDKQSDLFWRGQPISIVDAIVDSDGDAIFALNALKFQL